jgi:hypothetical protein
MISEPPLVTAGEEGGPIVPEALVYTLRYAALELLHTHKQLELRARNQQI